MRGRLLLAESQPANSLHWATAADQSPNVTFSSTPLKPDDELRYHVERLVAADKRKDMNVDGDRFWEMALSAAYRKHRRYNDVGHGLAILISSYKRLRIDMLGDSFGEVVDGFPYNALSFLL